MLQTEQMWIWISNSKTIEDIFKLLKLDTGVNKVLTNPTLNSWGTYIQFYNKYKGQKPTSMIDSLMKYYGDEAMAKMLEAAKNNPSTKKVATELQIAQFTQWLREGAKPAQIWKMLNMEKATWMTNPDANVWRGYLAFYKLHKTT
ncbi:Secreted RxLR effector peptide protein [Phytophthora palmivora]|uniref:Secreted RxLR effector peptide protein n=1 Tax=Phytophthora palmivora TaxID=4796 RepID=A0A2P4XKN6_9STRA|nr:Secreted RxLR effector peptide protein [Phytophthora palmivora]